MKFFIALFFIYFSSKICLCQQTDNQLLINHFTDKSSPVNASKPKFLKGKNPLTFPFRLALFGYQKVISPQWQSGCPHSPSCSNFSFQAIHYFGLLKGIALSADRLSRCSGLGIKDYPTFQFDFFSGMIDDQPSLYYWKTRAVNY